MGAPDRFEIHFNTFFGIGISYDKFPYEHNIYISIPFIGISIGLGKAYTDI